MSADLSRPQSAQSASSAGASLSATSAVAAIALSILLAAGCGGSKPKPAAHTEAASRSHTRTVSEASAFAAADRLLGQAETPPDYSHGPTVAVVGHTKITKAALVHWMGVVSPYKHEVPVPPAYAQCIINLRAKESIDSGGEGHDANALKGICKERYETLSQTALSGLLADARLIEEAARDGLELDRKALREELRQSFAQMAQRPKGAESYLKNTGRIPADVRFELETGQLSDDIYKHAEAKIPVVDEALIRRIYREQRQKFAVPATRDLYILHTKSKSAALSAKRQIESGQSFQSVVAGLHVSQPYGAKNGLRLVLAKKDYSEPVLANAIFAARPGALSGPIHVRLNPAYNAAGYYVFKVKRKIPAHVMSFAQAAKTIKEEAPQALRKKTIAAFVSAYKARWKAQTDCKPGYVVQGCRQAGPEREPEVVDRYVL